MEGVSMNADRSNGHAGNGRRRRPGRVLVIGGAGYVGSHLIPKLLERDHDVTVLDAFLFGRESIVEHAGVRRLRLVRGDIRSVESIVDACKGVNAIVHLGGLVGDPSCAVDRELTLDINLKATAVIAGVARGLRIPRMVFASSCAVYGAAEGVVDEESPLAPVSIYGQTKADSERLLAALASPSFSPTALRFGTLYGLSPRPRFDLVVNLLAAKAVRDGSISVFGGGQWRPFVHVEDGAEAVMACLRAPLDVIRGQAYNVGSDDQNRTLGDVAEMVRSMVPGVEVDYEEAAAAEADYRVSFAKIRRDLGFEPSHDLRSGILEIVAALESEVVGDYRQERYSNHKTLANGKVTEALGRLAPPVPVPLVA
jgi:nucleoside-diphosphate-sugar epimerase